MPGKYKSEDLRKMIVNEKQKGKTNREVADGLKPAIRVDQRTVGRIWNRWQELHTIKRKKIRGRQEKLLSGKSDFSYDKSRKTRL